MIGGLENVRLKQWLILFNIYQRKRKRKSMDCYSYFLTELLIIYESIILL